MTTLIAVAALILAVLACGGVGNVINKFDAVEKENKKLWEELDRQNKLRAVGK